MPKTVHVVPSQKGWAVKREGSGETSTFFSTQKEALAGARSLVKESASGRIVIHGKTGRIVAFELQGLPRIQKPPVKSSLGSRRIERAVSNLVQERLASF